MIITKTPLRIGLVGGSTDIPEYYKNYGGLLLSAAINKYIYIIVNKKFDHKIRVSYSSTEIVDTVDQIKHPSVREAMKLLNIDGGIEILSVSDIPSTGTGLGSSSTFLVGVLNALHAYKSEFASREQLAREAIEIERNILQEPGGMQDQYMASFGGINMLKFNENDSVYVNPVTLNYEKLEKLKDNMSLLYTGIGHDSGGLHKNIRDEITRHLDDYQKMKEYTMDFYHTLYSMDIKKLGSLLDQNWHSKRALYTKISTPIIDEYYSKALELGAYGGNLIGAGGGGFLVFIIEDKDKHKLRELGLRDIDFDFDFEGSRIIYFSQ
jgi:D-glycero-alpha-D-manno-heptose-7-phosphate kinase